MFSLTHQKQGKRISCVFIELSNGFTLPNTICSIFDTLELDRNFEILTFRLQDECSASELIQHISEASVAKNQVYQPMVGGTGFEPASN